ncbi:MAG: ERAP1-like C-terminal domain-containing protein [Terriglobales bacterium]
MKQTSLLIAFCWALTCFSTAQRLPRIAVPTNYNLTLTPNFTQDNFGGEETIQIQVLRTTSEIVLNAADLDFHDTTISCGGVSQKATVTLNAKTEMATLGFEHAIQPGPATITIRYTGILNNQLRGFYLGREEDGRKYAGTQLEATDARRAFPSFDEPEYKATFDITVVATQRDTVISNSKVLSDSPGPGNGKHTVRFATTPKMSSYLVAVVVGDFEYIEGSADGIPIRVYTTPGKKQLASFALDTAEHSIQYFDQYFGIKYPFGKLDLIGLPDFAAGAMENTGAITSREVALLLDNQTATLNQKRLVAEDVAHEVAHQWFGDLVTMKWWDDSWLNEGFAMWMQTKSVATWKPELNVLVDDVLNPDAFLGPDATLTEDSLLHTHAVRQSAETPGQITELFDAISYGKGASVLWMIEEYLGRETFRKGVATYIRQHAYGSATSEDFWNVLAAVSGKPVDHIMAAFINQPGVPLVSVKTQCAGNTTKVSLAQQRYFDDRLLMNSGNDEVWPIPVCMKAGIAGGRTRDQCVLLSKKEESFTLPVCATWVLGNAGANGYYRTAYDSVAVQAMSRSLEADFTPSEKIRLLSDEWAAVRIGRQTIADYMALADGLRGENDTAVVDMLTVQMEHIGRYLVNNGDRSAYQQWVRGLLTPLADKLGWQPSPGEDGDRKALRAQVLLTLGRTGHDPAVLEKASKLASDVLDKPRSMDAAMVGTVLRLAAANGDAAFYDQVLDRMKKASSPGELSQLRQVMVGFDDPKLLDRTLRLTMTPDIRSQDANALIAAVMANPAGAHLAWDFVREHWAEIEKKLGGYNSSGGLVAATGTFCDAELSDQVKDFFSAHPIPDAERTLQQSLETIHYCVDLKSQQAAPLAAWLEQHGSSTGE